jgi:hypothetical protein
MTLGLTPSSEETPERMAKRAAMNQEILEVLQAKLAENPSLNLDHEIPRLQLNAKRKYFPHPTALLLQQRQKPPQPKPQGFPASLLKSSAKPVILRPLSAKAMALIFENINEKEETGKDGDNDEEEEEEKEEQEKKEEEKEEEDKLNKGVRRLLENGEVIAKPLGRGGVLQCGDIAIKVVPAGALGSEYSALEYLAEHAPDFPAPKPHGLLGFGNSRLVLMSYIPSATITNSPSSDSWMSSSRSCARSSSSLAGDWGV